MTEYFAKLAIFAAQFAIGVTQTLIGLLGISAGCLTFLAVGVVLAMLALACLPLAVGLLAVL
jgi:hypothetical protein